MTKIIQFPNKPTSADLLLKGLVDACKHAGLTEAQELNVLMEFKKHVPQLCVSFNNELRLSPDLGLTSNQVKAVMEAHSETIRGFFSQHSNQMAYACTLIFDLLIREQLGGGNHSP